MLSSEDGLPKKYQTGITAALVEPTSEIVVCKLTTGLYLALSDLQRANHAKMRFRKRELHHPDRLLTLMDLPPSLDEPIALFRYKKIPIGIHAAFAQDGLYVDMQYSIRCREEDSEAYARALGAKLGMPVRHMTVTDSREAPFLTEKPYLFIDDRIKSDIIASQNVADVKQLMQQTVSKILLAYFAQV